MTMAKSGKRRHAAAYRPMSYSAISASPLAFPMVLLETDMTRAEQGQGVRTVRTE